MVGNTHGNQNHNGTSHNPTDQNIIGIRAKKDATRCQHKYHEKAYLYISIPTNGTTNRSSRTTSLNTEKIKLVGTFEITTQTYFTVLLRARISGRCGRKEKNKKKNKNNSIYLADRFLSKTLFRMITSNKWYDIPQNTTRLTNCAQKKKKNTEQTGISTKR